MIKFLNVVSLPQSIMLQVSKYNFLKNKKDFITGGCSVVFCSKNNAPNKLLTFGAIFDIKKNTYSSITIKHTAMKQNYTPALGLISLFFLFGHFKFFLCTKPGGFICFETICFGTYRKIRGFAKGC